MESNKELQVCIEVVRNLNKDIPQSIELLKHKANWLYILNKLSFWNDVPILMEIINYEKSKTLTNDKRQIKF